MKIDIEKLKKAVDISLQCEPEHMRIEGNASALGPNEKCSVCRGNPVRVVDTSGDDDTDIEMCKACAGIGTADAQTNTWIRSQLESGNEWAWCSVTVRVTLGDAFAEDHLGGCSYESKAAFTAPGGYYDDMVHQACNELATMLEESDVLRANLTDREIAAIRSDDDPPRQFLELRVDVSSLTEVQRGLLASALCHTVYADGADSLDPEIDWTEE